MNTLLWHNLWKRPLATAVAEASARHLQRLGSKPTHVILPLGECILRPLEGYPAEVGGLQVETCLTVKGLFMKVYRSVDGN